LIASLSLEALFTAVFGCQTEFAVVAPPGFVLLSLSRLFASAVAAGKPCFLWFSALLLYLALT